MIMRIIVILTITITITIITTIIIIVIKGIVTKRIHKYHSLHL